MHMTARDLTDRLAEHKTLGTAPREELAWLAAHGFLRSLRAGEVLSHKGMQVEGLYVVLSGHVSLSVDRGSGCRRSLNGGQAMCRGAALLADGEPTGRCSCAGGH